MTALTLVRERGGYYAGRFASHRVEVSFETTAYGDSGWFFYIDGERSDASDDTLGAAKARLDLNLALRHSEPYACRCAT